jgi:cell wall-associated NlpC family hydrolase
MNIKNYIGIPFLKNGNDREGCDCWKLIVMVYREQLGIELPDYAEIFVDDSLASLRRVARTMKEERLKWRQVQTPIPYDVILLRVDGLVCHAGLVIDRRRMLHIMDGTDSTVEEFTGLQWKQRVEGFYRWIIDKS